MGSRESKKEFSRKFISRRFDPHHYDDLKGTANNFILRHSPENYELYQVPLERDLNDPRFHNESQAMF